MGEGQEIAVPSNVKWSDTGTVSWDAVDHVKLYAADKQFADKESKVIFGGQLSEYKYYDMDRVIAATLERCRVEF